MADHKKAGSFFRKAAAACDDGDHKTAASHAGHGLNALKNSGMSLGAGMAKLKGAVAKKPAMKPTADEKVEAMGVGEPDTDDQQPKKPGFNKSRFAAFRNS